MRFLKAKIWFGWKVNIKMKKAKFFIIAQFVKAPSVTKKRIFYETMEDVFSDMDKVIIDKNGGDSVVPYLPLPELKKTQD